MAFLFDGSPVWGMGLHTVPRFVNRETYGFPQIGDYRITGLCLTDWFPCCMNPSMHGEQAKRVIVCGSRRWHDRDAIVARLAELPGDCTIVHGNAKGADKIAHQEAQKLGLLVEVHEPGYDLSGSKAAPLNRNAKMATLGADLCIAFWDGRSTGTAHMMDKAREQDIPVEVVSK